MEIFKGWYRESSTKGKWHRVNHVYSILKWKQMNCKLTTATTICNRKIPAMECDYKLKPCATTICQICLHKENIIKTGKTFIPTKITPLTRSKAIKDLRRF